MGTVLFAVSAFAKGVDDIHPHRSNGGQDSAEQTHDDGQHDALHQHSRTEPEGKRDLTELVHRPRGKAIERQRRKAAECTAHQTQNDRFEQK